MKAKDYGMVVVWSETDEAFLAHVLELPGCVADGATREEAVSNAADAIQDWIDTAKEIGRPIPSPLSHQDNEKMAIKLAEQNQAQFQKAVQEAVQKTLQELQQQVQPQAQHYAVLVGGSTWVERGSMSVSDLFGEPTTGRRR